MNNSNPERSNLEQLIADFKALDQAKLSEAAEQLQQQLDGCKIKLQELKQALNK